MIKIKNKERHGEFKSINTFSVTEGSAMKTGKKVSESTIGSLHSVIVFLTLSKLFFSDQSFVALAMVSSKTFNFKGR